MGDDLLNDLANDAFEVLNWARREGLKRPQQIEQVVSAFKKRLAESEATGKGGA